jgi:flagellar hook-basal body complex protein FliE
MQTNNVVEFKGRQEVRQDHHKAESASFDAMLNEAIEGLRHRRAARKQREAERQAKQDALSDAVYAVLATRKDLQITAGPELLITFLQATCHLKALVSEDGQVDLSWIYEGRSEPKYSGTVELEEAKDIVLHLVAVRLAAIHVEEDQAVG